MPMKLGKQVDLKELNLKSWYYEVITLKFKTCYNFFSARIIATKYGHHDQEETPVKFLTNLKAINDIIMGFMNWVSKFHKMP